MSRSERRTRSTYCSVVAEILEWTLRSISSAAIDVEAKVAERFAGGGASFRLPEYPDVTCTVTGFGGGGTEQMTVPLDGLVPRGTAHWSTTTDLTLEGPERAVRLRRATETDTTIADR